MWHNNVKRLCFFDYLCFARFGVIYLFWGTKLYFVALRPILCYIYIRIICGGEMDVRIENGICPAGEAHLPPAKSEVIRAALLFALSGEAPERAVRDCPDLAPLLAVAACKKTGETLICGTVRLRSKESKAAFPFARTSI